MVRVHESAADEPTLGPLAYASATRVVGALRMGIGVAQGVCAWALLTLVPSGPAPTAPGDLTRFWSIRHPTAFAALALIVAFTPAVALAEIGRMRGRRLAIYLMLAAAALAGLAAYGQWRDPVEQFGVRSFPRLWPSLQLWLGAAMALFIVNQLMEHRERGFPLFSAYAAHFEDSWMRGFQLAIALVFTLLVWAVLKLGGDLFAIIHVEVVEKTIEENWFRCPALGFAFAAAVHVVDVRPDLLRGMRNVGLTLLAWLLPLVTALAGAFLVTLVFTGLEPLWATRHGASTLLWAGATIMLLLIAAYKDGDPSLPPGVVVRWAGRAAGPILLILAALASYAIALRVGERGWTPDRVFAAAVAIVELLHGAGYAFAAVGRTWMKALEPVNVALSLAVLAIWAALLTSLADPARLAVTSQLGRLAAGAIAPRAFDYQFLRFDAGRYGMDALAALAHDPDADVAARAAREQVATTRVYGANGEPDAAATEPAFSHATIYPTGAVLPDDFRRADWSKEAFPSEECMRDGAACDIYLVRYGEPGRTAVIVEGFFSGATPKPVANVYERGADGRWEQTGTLSHMACAGVIEALRGGAFEKSPPEHEDLIAAGVRLGFEKVFPRDYKCPNAPPTPSTSPAATPQAVAPGRMGPAFGRPGGL
jgi:hypothetical protein